MNLPSSCRQLLLVTVACIAVPVGVAGEAPFDLVEGVPIVVKDFQGFAREGAPVTFGMPLPKDVDVDDVGDLVVLGPEGKVVPAQLRPTQRWNASPHDDDAPIRWLLIDLQVDVDSGGTSTYLLKEKGKKDKTPKGPKLKVKQSKKSGNVTVSTGSAMFVLTGKSASGLDRVMADLNGNGKVKKKEVLLRGGTRDAFVLTDRFGARYSTNGSKAKVEIEEKGKLRTVVRIDGGHQPLDPDDGIGREFFTVRTRYTFYAGKPYVRVQHTVRNAYLDDPLGHFGFEGYVWETELSSKVGPVSTATFGLQGTATESAAGPVRLRQDSDGGDKWNQAPDTTFRGFRLLDAQDSILASGNQAAGWMHVGDDEVGVTIVMKDFFENFPKTFSFDGDAALGFHIWPAETANFHWIDDGQQKTTEFLVVAHGKGSEAPADVARSFKWPLRPYPPADWIRHTRAWADMGDLDDPVTSDAALIAYDDNQLGVLVTQAFARTSYAFGWSEFGEQIYAKSTHTTGSPRNRLSYWDKFAMTGSYSAFRIPEMFALHSRDIRTYHIDGFSKEARPNATLWEALPPWGPSVDQLGRDTLDESLAPHRAGIPNNGHGWNAFDIEHMTVDDLYEHYLMTGDPVSYDSLMEIGEVMRTWPVYSLTKAPGSSRGVGWSMRSLIKIWQVTGAKKILDAADDLVASVGATYGQTPSPATGLVYHYVTRYIPHANHIATEPYDLPWQLSCVIYGFLLHHRETGDDQSREIALNVADYLVDYGWNGIAMNEALAVDDHNVFNYKGENSGINLWIPSSLALAYRENPRPEFLFIANYMYNSIAGLTDPVSYNGYGIHHWWHNLRGLILGQ